MSGISNVSNSQYLYHQQQLFKKLDADGDGSVNKDEFVNGRPSEVSADAAEQLFTKLDSSGSGSLTESDLENMGPPNQGSGGMGNMSGLDPGMLMDILNSLDQSQTTDASSSSANSNDPLAGMFGKIDANGDGTITKDEFVAARPSDVSESDSAALFAKIDTAGTGSVTEDQFVSGMKENAPPPPPPGGMSSLSGTDETTSLQDLLASLLDGSGDSSTSSTDTSSSSTASSTSSTQASALATALQQFLAALQSYMTSASYTDTSSVSSLLSTTA